jgi:hypothetical protein
MSTPAPVVNLAKSDETRRAELAAREAAIHLDESRARRTEVDDRVVEILRLNRENGFAEMIRQALGSGR